MSEIAHVSDLGLSRQDERGLVSVAACNKTGLKVPLPRSCPARVGRR